MSSGCNWPHTCLGRGEFWQKLTKHIQKRIEYLAQLHSFLWGWAEDLNCTSNASVVNLFHPFIWSYRAVNAKCHGENGHLKRTTSHRSLQSQKLCICLGLRKNNARNLWVQASLAFLKFYFYGRLSLLRINHYLEAFHGWKIKVHSPVPSLKAIYSINLSLVSRVRFIITKCWKEHASPIRLHIRVPKPQHPFQTLRDCHKQSKPRKWISIMVRLARPSCLFPHDLF